MCKYCIEQCHMHKMITSNSENDGKNYALLNTYLELGTYKLPLRKYKEFNNPVSKEINLRLREVQEIWVALKTNRTFGNRMGDLLCRIRNVCLGDEVYSLPYYFDPTLDELAVVETQLKYFGFMWGENLYLAKLFLYDICISLYKDFSQDLEFIKMYYEREYSNPIEMEKIMQRDILDDIIYEVIDFFRQNI